MRWYKNPKFDAPELSSPQPCAHGAGCDYKIKDKTTGELVRGCCAFVHPGEEGTGRRLFAARTTATEYGDRFQPACVRLTGAQNGFYERRGRRISWPDWCEQKGIPYTPNPPTGVATTGVATTGVTTTEALEGVELTPALQRVIDAAVQKALSATQHNPRRPRQRLDLGVPNVMATNGISLKQYYPPPKYSDKPTAQAVPVTDAPAAGVLEEGLLSTEA